MCSGLVANKSMQRPPSSNFVGAGEKEITILLDIYFATNGPSWKKQQGWLEEKDVSKWQGVTTSCGRVVELSLGKRGMSGSLPSLANLVWLQKLNIMDNKLIGPLPESVAYLPRLESVRGSNNALSGPIPGGDDPNVFPSITYFHVQKNKLSGKVPSVLLHHREGLDLRVQPGNPGIVSESVSLSAPQFPM